MSGLGNLRPLAFQVAASMVLWECYVNLGKPTEAKVSNEAVMRVVAPSHLDPDSDEAQELSYMCAECARDAPAWLAKEGLIRKAGFSNLDSIQWELTLAGVSALNLKLGLDSQVPDQTAGQYLGDLLGRVKAEADDRAPGLVMDAVSGLFGRILPLITSGVG